MNSDDALKIANDFNEVLRSMSDVVKGGVATLMAEGWDEESAKVVSTLVLVRALQGPAQE